MALKHTGIDIGLVGDMLLLEQILAVAWARPDVICDAFFFYSLATKLPETQ
jgi:hypothetical protein